MKIKVDADGHRFTIPIPVGIVLNGFTARIIARYLKRYVDMPLTAYQLNILCKELKHARKVLGNIPLIDVHSSDGNKVRITL